jgi:peptide deformylase
MPEPLEFTVTLYPAPVLRKVAEPVAAFDDELKRIVAAMFERMTASQGVGLAAPQVGLRRRILVLNPTGEPADALTLVNPTIVDRSGPATSFDEGCLSFPGIYAEVQRPDRCTVEAFDAEGKPLRAEYSGFVSRIVQHEYDHLEGVLLVDRMSPADKLRNKAALDELVDRYKSARKAAAARR